MEEDDDVVCKFRPQVRVFFNADNGISIEVTEADGTSDIVSIPLECAEVVAKAVSTVAKEFS